MHTDTTTARGVYLPRSHEKVSWLLSDCFPPTGLWPLDTLPLLSVSLTKRDRCVARRTPLNEGRRRNPRFSSPIFDRFEGKKRKGKIKDYENRNDWRHEIHPSNLETVYSFSTRHEVSAKRYRVARCLSVPRIFGRVTSIYRRIERDRIPFPLYIVYLLKDRVILRVPPCVLDARNSFAF